MDSQKSREIILNKIKGIMDQGRSFSIPGQDDKSDVFPKPADLLQVFEKELTSIGGNIIEGESKEVIFNGVKDLCLQKNIDSVYCIDPEIITDLNKYSISVKTSDEDFKTMQVGVTRCEFLVSRTGSVVISSQHPSGRRMNVFPPIHVVLAKKSQLVPFPDDALEILGEKYGNNFPSLVSFITGASRTADIEKTLIMGAHGPKKIYVFIDKNA